MRVRAARTSFAKTASELNADKEEKTLAHGTKVKENLKTIYQRTNLYTLLICRTIRGMKE